MAFIPFTDRRNNVTPSSAYLNAILISALYQKNEEVPRQYARMSGSDLVFKLNNPETFEPDILAYRLGSEAFVVLAGTTNVNQWISHVAGSWSPVVDDVTRNLVYGSVLAGTRVIQQSLFDRIGLLSLSKMQISGHSYGAGCAFMLATNALYRSLPQGRYYRERAEPLTLNQVLLGRMQLSNLELSKTVNVQTFGEMKVYGGPNSQLEPHSHKRFIAMKEIRQPSLLRANDVDVVCYSPPSELAFAASGWQMGLVSGLSQSKPGRRGDAVGLARGGMFDYREDAGYAIPFVALIAVLEDASKVLELHLMKNSYLPWTRNEWLKQREHPELAQFDGFVQSVISRGTEALGQGPTAWRRNMWTGSRLWVACAAAIERARAEGELSSPRAYDVLRFLVNSTSYDDFRRAVGSSGRLATYVASAAQMETIAQLENLNRPARGPTPTEIAEYLSLVPGLRRTTLLIGGTEFFSPANPTGYRDFESVEEFRSALARERRPAPQPMLVPEFGSQGGGGDITEFPPVPGEFAEPVQTYGFIGNVAEMLNPSGANAMANQAQQLADPYFQPMFPQQPVPPAARQPVNPNQQFPQIR